VGCSAISGRDGGNFPYFRRFFHLSEAFPHLHLLFTVSAPLLRLAPSSIRPYSQPMPSQHISCRQSRLRSSSPAVRPRAFEALPPGTRAPSRQTRFDCGFSENSTAFSLVFSLTCHQQSQKRRYSRRQHNILCFILDTPYRARYFHDCVTHNVGSKSTRQLRSLTPSNVPADGPQGSPAATEAEADLFAASGTEGTQGPRQHRPVRAVPGCSRTVKRRDQAAGSRAI
jgi:hypothetical protein